MSCEAKVLEKEPTDRSRCMSVVEWIFCSVNASSNVSDVNDNNKQKIASFYTRCFYFFFFIALHSIIR